jgi:hypothetical protein
MDGSLRSFGGYASLKLNLLHHGVVDTSARRLFVREGPLKSAPRLLQSFGDLLKPRRQLGRHQCGRRIAHRRQRGVGCGATRHLGSF